MNIAIRKPMTQDEFFRWAQSRDEPHEFDGIQPVAMTGASGNHGRIAGNIQFQLRLRLGENGPCEALTADAGVQTIGDAVRYPDGVVTCSGFDGRAHLVPDPVIVFEITSPSSIREDRIIKPREYAAVPSIKRYVIVEQTVIGLTVLWRTGDEPWRLQTLKAGDVLNLPEIGVEIPVDSLYARVDLDEAPAG